MLTNNLIQEVLTNNSLNSLTVGDYVLNFNRPYKIIIVLDILDRPLALIDKRSKTIDFAYDNEYIAMYDKVLTSLTKYLLNNGYKLHFRFDYGTDIREVKSHGITEMETLDGAIKTE